MTEPTIDEQIRLKLLSLINNLQDVWLEDKDSWYGAETTVPEIQALISDQVAKARIEENTRHKNTLALYTALHGQEEAKQALINDLEFIIGTNGVGELYDTEKELITLVGGCEVCGSIPMTVNCNNANCDYKE